MATRSAWRDRLAIATLTILGASGCLPGYETPADDGGMDSLGDGTVADTQPRGADGQAHEGGRDAAVPGLDGARQGDGAIADGASSSLPDGASAAADGATTSTGTSDGAPGGDGGPAPPAALGQGAACTGDGDCASQHCADGVCCDSACTGACQACNLPMFAGTCSPVARGQAAPGPPHDACAAGAASGCGNDGKCDGQGQCELWPNGTSCAAGTCNATTNQSVAGSACDGKGTCKPAAPVTCAPFKCGAAASCATSCAASTDCVGQPCVNGSCGTVANGSRCTVASQCSSGFCVDGYCCNSACAGSCQACDIASAEGTCQTLPTGAPHGSRSCSGSGVCQGACNGTSASCVYPTSSCAAQSCVSGTVSRAASCDGAGGCPAGTKSSCNGFACNGTSCFVACTSDLQCAAATPYCNAGSGACQAAAPRGHGCTAGTTCAAGTFCVDGVCCGSQSCPASDSCHAAGTCSPGTGTCTNPAVANGTACSDGNACTQSDTCTNGACSGSAVTCPATDACHLAGTCSTSTGLCSNPVAPDGTTCGTGSVCAGGTCVTRYALKFKMAAYGPASQTVTSSPAGISCTGTACSMSANYNAGTVVTLTIAPGGSGLYHWGGACSGTATTCSVTMTSAQPVTLTLNGNNYAFTTSQTFSANLGGLAGADAKCATAAASAGLPGHYVALLSTSATNANSRLGGARGWIRTDGFPVADDTSSLFGRGKMYYPIDANEFGAYWPATPFTGSNDQGNVTVIEGVTPATCGDWTTVDTSPNAGCGSAGTATIGWLGICGSRCDGNLALYCFGTDLANPVSTSVSSGRIAFLSTGTWDTASGVGSADAECRSEAGTAGLAGASSFIALLATNSASAASRLNTSGANWVRTDGLAIATSPSQFIAGTLAVPVVVAADGVSYAPTFADFSPMVGATSLTAVGADATTCNGWTSNASTATGETGDVGNTIGGGAFAWTARACGAYHVYCIQP